MTIQRITYAGHSAVFLETQDLTIAIDPWLEGNPRCPENLKNPARLDLIVLTHGHSDHASDAPRLAKKYDAFVIATYELAMIMIEEGVHPDKVIAMNKGGTSSFRSFSISLTHAFHSNSFDTAKGTRYAGEACGVIVNDSQRSIYHAGDTALFSDMKLIAENFKPEIALLPIGDRFTMGPKEAAIAAELIKPKIVIPIHYKTFDLLSGTPEQFVKELQLRSLSSEIEVKDLEPGSSMELK